MLRTVTQKAEETEAEQQADYLLIEETKGVEPLDLQIGADVRKTIPDALFAPIFNQSSPTEDETKHHGSSENLPSLETYAILDAAKVQFLTTYLEESDLPYKCLFKGDSAEELKDVAPYIVQLTPDSSFTRNLFTSAGMPANMWDKSPGIYFRSRASLDELWKHFRKFTRVQDVHGKWYYWRFWDSKNLPTVLKALDPKETRKFFFDGRIVSIHLAIAHPKPFSAVMTMNFPKEEGRKVA